MARCRYEEFPPAFELRRHVLAYWRFTVDPDPGEVFRHHVWPDGCVSMSIVGPLAARQGRVAGPGVRARVFEIRESEVSVGIRFWPDVGGAALGMAPMELRGRSIPLAGDVPGEIEKFDEFLRLRRVPAVRVIEPVRRVVEMLIDRCGVVKATELADVAGWTPRNLQRRFRDQVGLTPKEFARIRRVRSVIREILEGRRPWAEVAADYGYADQAHMSRDLAEITGFAPTAFEERLMSIEHTNVTP